MRNRQRHAEPGAERLDKGAVPLGVLPPHAVLDVRGDDLRPQRQQEMQQHHGVHAARERHQGAASLQAFRNVFPHRLALLWNQSVSNFIWTAKIFQALNQIVWFFLTAGLPRGLFLAQGALHVPGDAAHVLLKLRALLGGKPVQQLRGDAADPAARPSRTCAFPPRRGVRAGCAGPVRPSRAR